MNRLFSAAKEKYIYNGIKNAFFDCCIFESPQKVLFIASAKGRKVITTSISFSLGGILSFPAAFFVLLLY